ncbi:MAG TPA: DUF3299 domain-containing protein [Polyangiaceae bacterium]|nr:DUF3299 domain-containing protein [Polyangiaceae bacterium]
MTLRKPRATEVLEIVALAAGGALLVYYSCRTPEGQAESPRESKTFTAARADGEQSPDPGDGSGRRRAVEQAVRELIGGVALGQLDETQRAEAQRSLASLLERWNWGTEQNRLTAAAVIVQQVFDQAKARAASVELSAQQVRAIEGVARELARELLLLAAGESPGADGLSGALPAGFERVTWNQLGAFPYRDGVPLPAEVQALNGHDIGIFGFMLSLGDADNLMEFVLVESLWGCCFGSVPEVNQTILVRVDPNAPAQYSAAPQLVTGRLEVGEEREGGFVTSLYRITGATLRPVETAAP